jgi:hypothetical protein
MFVLAAETDRSDARFLPMSAIGTKQTLISTPHMSGFGGKADIPDRLADVR